MCAAQGGVMDTAKKPTAIVTGGAGDIGSAIARSLGLSGWDLWILDIRDEEFGNKKAQEIAAFSGASVHYKKVDQCDATAMQAAVDAVDGLSLMVVTAATVKAQPFLEIELDAWKKQIDLNLTGSFIASQIAAKKMAKEKTKGQIIFISSWVAERPWPEITAYTSSKAGVNQLMRQLALELAPLGIRANAIAPGIVKAGLAKNQLENEPAYAARVATAIPLGELQEATDIAQAVAFMASPAASTMTGSVMTIDGGCTLGQIR
jgi:NAD(P)-dependent dehydrogenase (short-subunit alcohol dehydrogenase family)